MCLEQMASRCPDSTLIAIGTLKGYRWQINQRGVANIVLSSPYNIVFGIVFRVSKRDVKNLDQNEGISKGFYEKETLDIELQRLLLQELSENQTTIAAKALRDSEETPRGVQTSSPRSVETANDYTQQRSTLNFTTPTNTSTIPAIKMVPALVYLSRQYCNDGSIRAEYVSRMTLAVADGKTLGISSSYLEHGLQSIMSSKPQDPIQPIKRYKAKSTSGADLQDPRRVTDKGRNVYSQRRKHGHFGDRRKGSRSVDGDEQSGAERKRSRKTVQRQISQNTWLYWTGSFIGVAACTLLFSEKANNSGKQSRQ